MTLWRIRTDVRLRDAVWDDGEVVVYNASVGHTHVLNAPVRAVIQRMTKGYASIDELYDVYCVALSAELRDAPPSAETILSLLQELARFGMVEQKPE